MPIHSAMPQPEIQLSAAEKRLLRKTFRRHAAPYLVLAAASAVWALSWGRIETQADPAALDPDTLTVVVADPAFQRLASRVERSQAELRELAKRSAPAADPASSELAQKLAAVEQRASQAERRLRELEQRQAGGQGLSGAGASEVAGILDRLQRIERRQDHQERGSTAADAGSAATQRAVLDRLQNLESRLSSVEGAGSPSM